MHAITAAITHARRRMFMSRWLHGLVWVGTTLLVWACGARLGEKLGLFAVNWPLAGAVGAGLCVLGSLVWALLRRPGMLDAARTLDAGADLRETLSTAWHVRASDDAWSQSVVAYAQSVAPRVDVRRAVPVRGPERWWVVVVAGVALVVTWILPIHGDLLGRNAQDLAAKEHSKRLDQVRADAAAAQQKVQDQLAKLDPNFKNDDPSKDPGAGELKPKELSAEQVQRAAIKNLTSMQERLEQLKKTGAAGKAEDLAAKLEQLKPGAGPLTNLVQDMARADFASAKQELEKLTKSLSDGSLSAASRDQLAQQAQNLAQQLDKLAGEKKSLQDKLASAGLNPELAANPDALKQALAQSKSLTPQQKKQLQNAAEAMNNACKQCNGMGSALKQMAQAAQSGDPQQAANAAASMGEQLSEAQMAQAELDNMEAALSEASKQLEQMGQQLGMCEGNGDKMGACQNEGTRPWNAGENLAQGNGRGGPGRGAGGSPGESPADEKWAKRKSKSPLGQGPMIGTMFIQGEQIRGDSRAEFSSAVEAAEKSATDQISSNVIPKEYQQLVKDYFGGLSKRAGGEDFTPAPPPQAAPSTPPAPGAAGSPK